MAKIRDAEKGERTVYVEHGIWYDETTGRIHVTVSGRDGGHWSMKMGGDATGVTNDRMFHIYRGILEERGRFGEPTRS